MRQIHMIFTLDSPHQAETVYNSLQPELKKDVPNTDIKLEHDQNILSLTITAKNTSTLRAASNSYIRWIQTALNITNSI
jgi:tRNA threonylcarbamoyladenosine modification (KEOPS) complex  Pcc1 subunit